MDSDFVMTMIQTGSLVKRVTEHTATARGYTDTDHSFYLLAGEIVNYSSSSVT